MQEIDIKLKEIMNMYFKNLVVDCGGGGWGEFHRYRTASREQRRPPGVRAGK